VKRQAKDSLVLALFFCSALMMLALCIYTGVKIDFLLAVAGGDEGRMAALRAMPYLLAAGVLLLTVCGLLNLSLHRRSDKNLVEELRQALDASRAKSGFLSTMSHEIRTPMNAIIGMTRIARTSDDLEHKDHCLDKIEDASTHLLGVINEILDMSKIEAGKLDLSSILFDLDQMLDKVMNVISFRMEEKHQTLRLEVDSNIPKALVGDDQRIIQVITNLMSNAVKFTPEWEEICLTAKLQAMEGDDCTVFFCVKDSGIGISAEQQARLFNAFEQAETATARKFGGTGLGLAISKNIVELMGGKIWVASQLGQGAAFMFTVVLKRGQLENFAQHSGEAAANEAAANEVADFDGYRILLAEDVEINREIVLTLLEPTGLEIVCAENGAEALQLFRENPAGYAMIFMDVQMPEMDGYEATRRLRALDLSEAKAIPIIAMTANVFKEDIEQCLAAGIDGHVGKPLNFGEVLHQLRQHLLSQKPQFERRKADRRQQSDRRQVTGDRRQEERRKGDRRKQDIT